MTSGSRSTRASTHLSPSERELRKRLNRANRRLATIERHRQEARQFRPVIRLVNALGKLGEKYLQ